MVKGGVVDGEVVASVCSDAIGQAASEFTGFILDGLPYSSNQPTTTFNEEDNGFTLLEKAANIPRQKLVLVNLNISNENLVRRRAARWVDPKANQSYSGQQVLYSRTRLADGYVEGEEDTVAKEEHIEMYGKRLALVVANEGDDADVAVIEHSRAAAEQAPFSIKNKQTWPILSESILNRLIKVPEDDPALFTQELDEYEKLQQKIDEFRQSHFDILTIIDLDASQHPDLVFEQLKKQCLIRGFSVYNPVSFPRRLVTMEGGFKTMSEIEIFKTYTLQVANEGDPAYSLSMYKKSCPVTFYTQNTLVDCDLLLAAVYKSYVYFLRDEEAMGLFLGNPDKYLLASLAPAHIGMCIIGQQMSGKTTYARLIAEKYDLNYVCIDTLVADRFATFTNTTRQALIEGKTLADAIYVQLIVDTIAKGKKSRGWVLDGFPRTPGQAAALAQSSLVTSHVISLTNGTN